MNNQIEIAGAPSQALAASAAAMVAKGLANEVARKAACLNGDYSTLILDEAGTIRRCGTAGEQLLGARPNQVDGMPIATFINELSGRSGAPSYHTRFLAHLCSAARWRAVTAVDLNGRRISLQIHLARVCIDGEKLYLLTLRRDEQLRKAVPH